MKEKVRVRYGIVCDDARREDNGKIILIGIYGSNIVLQKIPAVLPLCTAIFYDADASIELPFTFRVLLGKEQLNDGNGKFNFSPARNGISLIPNIPLSITNEGMLKFEIRFERGAWQTIAALPVVVRPPK